MKKNDKKTEQTLELLRMADRGVQKPRPRSVVFDDKTKYKRNREKELLRKEME